MAGSLNPLQVVQTWFKEHSFSQINCRQLKHRETSSQTKGTNHSAPRLLHIRTSDLLKKKVPPI